MVTVEGYLPLINPLSGNCSALKESLRQVDEALHRISPAPVIYEPVDVRVFKGELARSLALPGLAVLVFGGDGSTVGVMTELENLKGGPFYVAQVGNVCTGGQRVIGNKCGTTNRSISEIVRIMANQDAHNLSLPLSPWEISDSRGNSRLLWWSYFYSMAVGKVMEKLEEARRDGVLNHKQRLKKALNYLRGNWKQIQRGSATIAINNGRSCAVGEIFGLKPPIMALPGLSFEKIKAPNDSFFLMTEKPAERNQLQQASGVGLGLISMALTGQCLVEHFQQRVVSPEDEIHIVSCGTQHLVDSEKAGLGNEVTIRKHAASSRVRLIDFSGKR